MSKVLWFDVETTGLKADKHSIIQLAAIVEIDGEVVAEKEFLIQPLKDREIDPVALQVNGRSSEEIKTEPFLPVEKVFPEILRLFDLYIDRFDRSDKFFIGGYNVDFDVDFLASLFGYMRNNWLGSYVNWVKLDPIALVNIMTYMGLLDLPNRKLLTVCNHFGIELGEDAHDAIADIKATRELFGKLLKVQKMNPES